MSRSQPLVLLVEPNRELDDLEQLILQEAGYRVETPPSGESA